jgi:hypothetical protein
VSHEFDAVVGESQVLIKCSADAVAALRDGVGQLAEMLDYAPPKRPLRERMRHDMARRSLLRRLFPAVSAFGPMSQEFDDRWGDILRTELFGATQRVLGSIGDDGTARYQLAAIDDWIRVLGQTRLLWVERSETGDPESEDVRLRRAGVFTWMQTRLITALRPELEASVAP